MSLGALIHSPSVVFPDQETFFLEKEASPSFCLGWKNDLKNVAQEIYYDCNYNCWDGYNAFPITLEALASMQRLINLLPQNIISPEVVPDPSGELSLEWREKNNKIVLMTVSKRSIVYAAIISDDHKTHGKEPFNNEIPIQIEKILSKYFQNK